MRIRARLPRLFAPLFLSAIALEASAQSGSAVRGTYRIAVCKTAPCTPGDTTNAIVVGRLVLFDSALHTTTVHSLRWPFNTHYLRAPANGCYALQGRPSASHTYAAGAGTTRWDRESE